MQPKIFHSIYFHDPHESCVHNGICTIKLCYIKVFQNIFSLTMVQLAFSWGFTIFRMSHFKLLSKNRLRSNGRNCWCDFFLHVDVRSFMGSYKLGVISAVSSMRLLVNFIV